MANSASILLEQVRQATGSRIISKRQSWLTMRRLLPLFVLALTFAAYAGTLRFQFVYDDTEQIMRNPHLLSWSYAPTFFVEHVWGHQNPNPVGNYYRPLFLLWLLVNRMLFGLNPFWWHLTTILAHLAVTFMVYRLAERLVGDRTTAAIAALVFGLHPVHIEAVAWISGVTEPLMAFMLIAGFLCYLNKRDRPQSANRWFAASLLFYVLAMLAKETALVLPLIILAYEWAYAEADAAKHPGAATWGAFLKNRFIVSAKCVAPYLLLTTVYLIIRAVVLKGLAHTSTHLSLATTVLTWPALLWFYVKLLIWPVGLSVFYDTPYVTAPGLRNFIAPVIALTAIAVLLWQWSRRAPVVRYAVAWLVLPILPVLNIAVFYDGELAHDRYLYLPSIGFAILVAFAVRQITAGSFRLLNQPALQVLVVATLVCALNQATVSQSAYWADNFALYSRGVAMAPSNFLAINNLGSAWAKQSKYEEAIKLYLQAIERKPLYWSSNCNLGYSYYALARYEEAESYLLRAIEIYPRNARQFFCLGLTQMKLGRLGNAVAMINHAIEMQPQEPDYHYGLGLVLKQQGNLATALDEFNAELLIRPDHPGARQEVAEIDAQLRSGSPRGLKHADSPAEPEFRNLD
ncbi:MAG: protein O-mannosyl-transferase [Blastocatellia bacterium]